MYYICVAKTKALISFAVTAKLICVFVFAYAKSRFSHNEAHLILVIEKNQTRKLNYWEDLVLCSRLIELFSEKVLRQ